MLFSLVFSRTFFNIANSNVNLPIGFTNKHNLCILYLYFFTMSCIVVLRFTPQSLHIYLTSIDLKYSSDRLSGSKLIDLSLVFFAAAQCQKTRRFCFGLYELIFQNYMTESGTTCKKCLLDENWIQSKLWRSSATWCEWILIAPWCYIYRNRHFCKSHTDQNQCGIQ